MMAPESPEVDLTALLRAADERMAKREALARWDAAVAGFNAERNPACRCRQMAIAQSCTAETAWVALTGLQSPFATALPDQWTREA
jgi:hypothetical protein